MIESLRARWAIIIAVTVLAIVWTMPNFLNLEKTWWPTKSKMVMGLDIQGGSHLVLRVDVESAVTRDAKRIAEQLKSEMAEQKVNISQVTVQDPLLGQMTIEGGSQEAVVKFLADFYGQVLQVSEETPQAVKVEFSELYVRDFQSRLLEQAISTIRNRIDEFGVAEPSITAQGTDRILVQLPGIKDASTAKDLINRTARLDFMIVDNSISPMELEKMYKDAETEHGIDFTKMTYSKYVDRINEVLKDKLPKDTLLLFEKPENAVSMEAGRVPMLLNTNESVTGDRLTNAVVNFDQRGSPVVSFAFDAVGARQFADLTTKNNKQLMAIVLDKVIKSAPQIREPITGGRGQIDLGSSRNPEQMISEAKVIALSLRAGSLPATLEQLEERTVGPSLGADAIRKGEIATLIAAVIVFIFMLVYYRSFGIVADISLALNLILVIAILSSLGATLTLPGIAGLALTIGMAVDANVIIFERIKEELAKGASLSGAVSEGFDRAFSSIFDSNVTSIAVCVILYYYGTGPVRGFAVTLLTGLVINLFTAVFFSRAMFDTLIGKWKMNLAIKW